MAKVNIVKEDTPQEGHEESAMEGVGKEADEGTVPMQSPNAGTFLACFSSNA